jgi:hypothetical protein
MLPTSTQHPRHNISPSTHGTSASSPKQLPALILPSPKRPPTTQPRSPTSASTALSLHTPQAPAYACTNQAKTKHTQKTPKKCTTLAWPSAPIRTHPSFKHILSTCPPSHRANSSRTIAEKGRSKTSNPPRPVECTTGVSELHSPGVLETRSCARGGGSRGGSRACRAGSCGTMGGDGTILGGVFREGKCARWVFLEVGSFAGC